MSPSEWRMTGRPASRKTANMRASRGLIICRHNAGENKRAFLRAVVIAEVAAIHAECHESPGEGALDGGDPV